MDTPLLIEPDLVQSTEHLLLAVYVNDHLAGSYAGVELIRRLAKAHRGSPTGDVLQRLADEIAEDRATLKKIMKALDIRPRRRAGTKHGWHGSARRWAGSSPMAACSAGRR